MRLRLWLGLTLVGCTSAPAATAPEPATATVEVPPSPAPTPPSPAMPAPSSEARHPPETSLEIELPKSRDATDLSPHSVLVITKQGDLVFEGKVLKDMASLEAQARHAAVDRVIIMADSAVLYGRVIKAMDAMKRGGVTTFAFAVEPVGGPPPVTPPPP